MSDVQSDMVSDFKAADRAMRIFNGSMLAFQAACLRLDWQGAEDARGKLIAAIDVYLDHIAAAYKRSESA